MTESPAEAPASDLKKASGRFLLFGILTVLAGILAVSCPLVPGLAVGILAGVFLFLGGIFQILQSFRAAGWGKGILAFISGLLAVVCGLVMIADPLFALGILTVILIAYFLLDGIAKVVVSFNIRHVSGWGWMLFSGIITLLLAILIWRQWPFSGIWAVGTLVGVNLLMDGWTMIALGTVGREAVADDGRAVAETETPEKNGD